MTGWGRWTGLRVSPHFQEQSVGKKVAAAKEGGGGWGRTTMLLGSARLRLLQKSMNEKRMNLGSGGTRSFGWDLAWRFWEQWKLTPEKASAWQMHKAGCKSKSCRWTMSCNMSGNYIWEFLGSFKWGTGTINSMTWKSLNWSIPVLGCIKVVK